MIVLVVIPKAWSEFYIAYAALTLVVLRICQHTMARSPEHLHAHHPFSVYKHKQGIHV